MNSSEDCHPAKQHKERKYGVHTLERDEARFYRLRMQFLSLYFRETEIEVEKHIHTGEINFLQMSGKRSLP